jgi:6,7-dimethyl-8-ribityllumazine synthase
MGTAATTSEQLPAGDFQLAVVLSRYNEDIVEALLAGTRRAWRVHGGQDAALRVERVPGAFELPLAARALALSGTVDAVVALGCVIRGETAHFDYIAGECARGLQRVMLDTGVPIAFGVLTVEDRTQALERAGSGPQNKGHEALETALAMASLLRRLR